MISVSSTWLNYCTWQRYYFAQSNWTFIKKICELLSKLIEATHFSRENNAVITHFRILYQNLQKLKLLGSFLNIQSMKRETRVTLRLYRHNIEAHLTGAFLKAGRIYSIRWTTTIRTYIHTGFLTWWLGKQKLPLSL